jgi:iron complex outermembrane recepter protein
MINKYLLSVFACLCITQSVWAQYKITGIIKNKETSKSLAGAMVYLIDLKTGVQTDISGNYEVSNLKTGNYLIEISFAGFNTIVNQYFIDKDTIVNFELSTSHKEITEVIITGLNRSTEVKQNPVIIKSLSKNYLNQNVATNLIDALRNVPGINQITTGASISKPVIRGLGYNRVISLLNGIKQEGQQWGDEHGIEIDEYAIDKIEIIKGPGSLMYGSDGIAGVVNFLSPKSPTLGLIKTKFVSNYQSNNNLLGYSISNAGNIKGIQWLGRLSNKYASNYKNIYDGKVFNSGSKEINGSLFLGLNRNWGHTHLHINSYNNTINLPEGDRDSAGNFVFENAGGAVVSATANDLKGYKIGFPHQTINHLRVSSTNYFILKKGTINLDLGFQNNKRKEYASIANPNEVELFFDMNTFTGNARYNLVKKKGWETSLGIGAMQQIHTNRGEEYLIPNYGLLDIGVYAFTQKTCNKKWTVAGGLRLDKRAVSSNKLILDSAGKATTVEDVNTELKFEAFKNNYNGVAGSVGFSYQASKISTIKFNVSRGFRAPNIAELASNGRHEGTFRYEIGNANLKSEISHQIDLAYFLNSEHIALELTPFANFISNYIYTK